MTESKWRNELGKLRAQLSGSCAAASAVDLDRNIIALK
jgi:hypothetical protein